MPSIANQDFKIYGRLGSQAGIPAKYCGELYAAFRRAISITEQASFIDGFVFSSGGDSICRMLTIYNYIDTETEQIESINPSHVNPSYYDALWAIQQAIYAYGGRIAAEDLEFEIVDGYLRESGYGYPLVNEDGYLIKGTIADGKLASLYLGEKAEHPDDCVVVRLESLLPLVGELPMETTEIW